jgi:hypothetical protein
VARAFCLGSASILLAEFGILPDGVSSPEDVFVRQRIATGSLFRGKMPRMTGNMPALPVERYSRAFVSSIILSHG